MDYEKAMEESVAKAGPEELKASLGEPSLQALRTYGCSSLQVSKVVLG